MLLSSKETQMKRLLSLAVVLGVVLAVVNESDAQGKKNGGGNKTSTSQQTNFSNYKDTHGQSFSHGYFYPGSYHTHWTSWCWNQRYNCYFYWCPSACCNYYWYAPSCCYYPESCIASYPPTHVTYSPGSPTTPPLPITTQPTVQVTTPIQVTSVNQNNLTNGVPPVGPVGPVGPPVGPVGPPVGPAVSGPPVAPPPPGPGIVQKTVVP